MRSVRLYSYFFVLASTFCPLGVKPAVAFFFSTGNPNHLMAMASRPEQPGRMEIEAADDFVVNSATSIHHATFTGLLTGGFVDGVGVGIYRVFPHDSSFPPDGRVPTRVNSPADVEMDDRSTSTGDLAFSTTNLSPSFTTINSVLNGIHPIPNQTTGGEGPVTGEEVLFDVTFTAPFVLPSDHYFFVPQVAVTGGEFYWLSAPKPIVPPGTPFAPDLQTWMRDSDLAPDWLRVGTDIVGGTTTYNAAFTLDGTETVPAVPEPASAALLGAGLIGLGASIGWRKRRL